MSANRACTYCEEEILPDQACSHGTPHAKDCCAEAVKPLGFIVRTADERDGKREA